MNAVLALCAVFRHAQPANNNTKSAMAQAVFGEAAAGLAHFYVCVV
jgi:hypothetical protein